jgi:hypothetical protein
MKARHLAAAALALAGGYLAAPVGVRRWHQHWGATDEEIARSSPGDDLVPAPKLDSTQAMPPVRPVRRRQPAPAVPGGGPRQRRHRKHASQHHRRVRPGERLDGASCRPPFLAASPSAPESLLARSRPRPPFNQRSAGETMSQPAQDEPSDETSAHAAIRLPTGSRWCSAFSPPRRAGRIQTGPISDVTMSVAMSDTTTWLPILISATSLALSGAVGWSVWLLALGVGLLVTD